MSCGRTKAFAVGRVLQWGKGQRALRTGVGGMGAPYMTSAAPRRRGVSINSEHPTFAAKSISFSERGREVNKSIMYSMGKSYNGSP